MQEPNGRPEPENTSPAALEPPVPPAPETPAEPLLTAAAAPEESVAGAAEESADDGRGSPNWMLAFVCAWAGGTAVNEAWAVARETAVASLAQNPAFLGYSLLAVGLFAFAAEALRWGVRRRGLLAWAMVALPALLTLAGVVALVISKDAGRRI